ncbi:hypothetical protein [Rarobacter incanus]|uniref:Biotin transport system permease protein n=1 Tax=Rarobacter incanus TaxID=153494 RepID=A0A542SMH3_9MICO|nr:biotin transport system permease protein [Rarobacter incanus]
MPTLAAFVIAITVLDSLAASLIALGIATLACAVVGMRCQAIVFACLRAMAVTVPVFLLAWWSHSLAAAAQTSIDLTAAIAGALAVVSSTRADDLIDSALTAMGPLRRVGVDTDRIALSVALMQRSIPALGATMTAATDAARARGIPPNARVIITPVALRAVTRAINVGEAIHARGLTERSLPPHE